MKKKNFILFFLIFFIILSCPTTTEEDNVTPPFDYVTEFDGNWQLTVGAQTDSLYFQVSKKTNNFSIRRSGTSNGVMEGTIIFYSESANQVQSIVTNATGWFEVQGFDVGEWCYLLYGNSSTGTPTVIKMDIAISDTAYPGAVNWQNFVKL